MIGIIMMTYNSSWSVEQAIRSVQMQDYSNWTLAITDDGSTDATPDIIRDFSEWDDRIVALSIEHKGGEHAFNHSLKYLLEHTSCRFISKLDSDDYYFPYTLRTNAGGISINDVVYADHIIVKRIYGNEQVIGRSRSPSPSKISPSTFLKSGNVIPSGTLMVRRKKLEQLLPDPFLDISLKGGWDMEWVLRMLICGFKFVKIDDLTYVYRTRPDSSFQVSTKDGRWIEWRKQLNSRHGKYRKMAEEYL